MYIYTLQFPILGKLSRIQFLEFTKKRVVEFAFKHQTHFVKQGLTAEYFHKDKHTPLSKQVPVLIHALNYNNLFTLRAYGEKAADTLRLWLHLFAKQAPDITEHTLEILEHFTPKTIQEPQVYYSKNWIAINKMVIKDGFYTDLENNKYLPNEVLSKKLAGHLRTFLNHLNTESNLFVEADLLEYPKPPKKIIALKTKVNQKNKNIYKQAFEVSLKTNLQLPLYFSLGQNIAYGNGVFAKEV